MSFCHFGADVRGDGKRLGWHLQGRIVVGLRTGDAVLLKASRGVQLERALAVLDTEGVPPPPPCLG